MSTLDQQNQSASSPSSGGFLAGLGKVFGVVGQGVDVVQDVLSTGNAPTTPSSPPATTQPGPARDLLGTMRFTLFGAPAKTPPSSSSSSTPSTPDEEAVPWYGKPLIGSVTVGGALAGAAAGILGGIAIQKVARSRK